MQIKNLDYLIWLLRYLILNFGQNSSCEALLINLYIKPYKLISKNFKIDLLPVSVPCKQVPKYAIPVHQIYQCLLNIVVLNHEVQCIYLVATTRHLCSKDIFGSCPDRSRLRSYVCALSRSGECWGARTFCENCWSLLVLLLVWLIWMSHRLGIQFLAYFFVWVVRFIFLSMVFNSMIRIIEIK